MNREYWIIHKIFKSGFSPVLYVSNTWTILLKHPWPSHFFSCHVKVCLMSDEIAEAKRSFILELKAGTENRLL